MNFDEHPFDVQKLEQDVTILRDKNHHCMIGMLRNPSARNLSQLQEAKPVLDAGRLTLQTDTDITLTSDCQVLQVGWQPEWAEQADLRKPMSVSEGYGTMAEYLIRFFGVDIGETGPQQDIIMTTRNVVNHLARAARELDVERGRVSDTGCTCCGSQSDVSEKVKTCA